MRLPGKDSATWRAIITAAQVVVGGVVLYFTNDSFKSVVDNCWQEIVVYVPAATAATTAIWNIGRKDVNNY